MKKDEIGCVIVGSTTEDVRAAAIKIMSKHHDAKIIIIEEPVVDVSIPIRNFALEALPEVCLKAASLGPGHEPVRRVRQGYRHMSFFHSFDAIGFFRIDCKCCGKFALN